jgi:hypothetical protein
LSTDDPHPLGRQPALIPDEVRDRRRLDTKGFAEARVSRSSSPSSRRRLLVRDQYAFPDDSHPKSLSVSEHTMSIVTADWLTELFAPETRTRSRLVLAQSRSPTV